MRSKDTTTDPTGPLSTLVDKTLNKPLAEQVAENLEEKDAGAARSEAEDYAPGTTEHEDDREAPAP
jgi:hypothetical protein